MYHFEYMRAKWHRPVSQAMTCIFCVQVHWPTDKRSDQNYYIVLLLSSDSFLLCCLIPQISRSYCMRSKIPLTVTRNKCIENIRVRQVCNDTFCHYNFPSLINLQGSSFLKQIIMSGSYIYLYVFSPNNFA